MSTTYPGTIQTFDNPMGTSILNNPSHAGQHSDANDTIEAIQTVLGSTAATAALKNFSAGQFPVRVNTSEVIQQTIAGGTLNNTVQGTTRTTGGTLSGAIVGTSTVQGGTVANALVGTSQVTGGTLANNAIGTPTFLAGTLVVSGTTVTFQPGAAIVAPVGTLTDAVGTIAINAQAAQLFEITMGTTAGNRTLGTPSNPINGQFLGFRFKQNTNNTGTIVYPAIYRFFPSGTPTLGTQSTWNYLGFRYNATDTKWDFQGVSAGLI